MATIKKFVKKLDNWFLIQEMVLTKQWETLVQDLEKSWVSDEWIASVLSPYDAVKKTNKIDTKLVSISCQYFKKDL